MTTNPYSPPLDSSKDSNDPWRGRDLEYRNRTVEFRVDASLQGIRAQRASAFNALIDVAFVGTTILTASSIPALLFTSSSIACLAVPVWIVVGIVWIANVNYRRGKDFVTTCPGLVGMVAGRWCGDQLELSGPRVRFASKVSASQVRTTKHGINVWVPGTQQVIKVRHNDIVAVSDSEDNRLWTDASEGLLGPLPTTIPTDSAKGLGAPGDPTDDISERCTVAGKYELRGSDLIGFPLYRKWRTQMAVAIGLAVIAIAISFFLYLQIPPKVLNYSTNDVVRMPYNRMIFGMYSIALISIPLVGIGVYLLTKSSRVYGRFQIAVSPQVISVAGENQVDRCGLIGEGKEQVRWSESGLQVYGKKNRLLFHMPSRWFNEEQLSWLSQCYADNTSPPDRDDYFGPRLG